jgi:hypothetical protein
MRRAVTQADDREPSYRLVVVRRQEPMEDRAGRVDRRRRVAREQLERDERRPAHGRALVLESAPEQLELLPEPELPDRAIRDRALAVVSAAGRPLELVRPLQPEIGELALRAALGELLGLRGCFLQRQEPTSPFSDRGAGPTYRADGRNRRPVLFCSRM